MSDAYVRGYHPRENERLQDQAGTLVDLLHALCGNDLMDTDLYQMTREELLTEVKRLRQSIREHRDSSERSTA